VQNQQLVTNRPLTEVGTISQSWRDLYLSAMLR